MNCPNCATEMTAMTLDGYLGVPVAIDLCAACQAFWFDKHESLKLSPRSTLQLMKFVGEHSSSAKSPLSESLRCPRCASPLLATHDLQRNTRFSYWRCSNEHGRFIRFFEFLREKNFIRILSPHQIEELRKNLQTVNCSNCGAPIDLATASACTYCGSPISMLDIKQPEALLNQLRMAAEPRPIEPALPLELAKAKREVETSFGTLDCDLIQAGLTAVARWLTKSGF
jgi:Zn-finger nucleic acid-binding protein/ribosomal protein S27AE